jgi:hypothetical protein
MPNPKPSSKKSLEEMWAAAANAAALMSLEQTTGMTLSDPSDPHGSLNALLAAARSQNSTLTRPPMLKSKRRSPSSKSVAVLANREVLIAAAQAAGVSLSSLDPSDPRCSKNNLLEAPQAHSNLTRSQRSRSRPVSKSNTVGAAALGNHKAKQGQLQIPPWAKGLLDLIPPPIKRAKRAPSKVQEKASTTAYDLDCGEGKGY